MPFHSKFAKLYSPVKAIFTRSRNSCPAVSHTGQPSRSDDLGAGQTDATQSHALQAQPHPAAGLTLAQPSTSAAHDPAPATESAQLAAPSASAIASRGADDHARDADGPKDSWLSRGFAAFKSALEVTKEFAEPFPPLKYAATALLIVMEGFEKVKDVQEDFEYVAEKLKFMHTIYNEHRTQLEASESMKASMDSLAQAMRIVEKVVQAKSDRGFVRRIWENPSDVKEVADALRMLGDVVDRFIMSVAVLTHALLVEGLQEQVLDKLDFAKSAQFDSIENG